MEIKVLYHNQNAKPIGQVDEDSWIDLRAAETVTFSKGEFKLVSLGISVEMPEGYEAIIAPRSSTFKNYGVIQTNGIGVVDNDYRSEEDIWKIPFYATRDVVINAGDRIAQTKFVKTQGHVDIKEVKELKYEPRGGFGHSGV